MNNVKFTIYIFLIIILQFIQPHCNLYAETTSNTTDFSSIFYGTGISSQDFEEATELAIQDIYKNISLSFNISDDNKNKIKLYINVPNYTIFEMKNINKKQYKIVIGINKEELVDIQKIKLDKYMQILDMQLNEFENKNDFFKKKFYNENLLITLNNIDNMLILLKKIEPTFQSQEYETKVEKTKYICEKYIQNITVRLDFETSELSILSNDIKEYLNQIGIQINNMSKNILLFSINNNEKKIDDSYNITSNFVVKLINNNKIIIYKSVMFQSKSLINYFDCLDKNIEKFRKYIKTEQIELNKL